MTSELTNKRILVTGGAGFIGSNLCEFLISSGSKVRCLDNFSTGRKSNIINLLTNKNFEIIEGDIINLDTCLAACNDIDYVLHHAALGAVPRSVKDPILTTPAPHIFWASITCSFVIIFIVIYNFIKINNFL